MTFVQKLNQRFSLVVILALLVAVILPILVFNRADAAILSTRYIRMSSSANAATDVTYAVGFTIGTTANVGSIAIDFCENSPIIGDACTDINASEGFDVNEAGLAIANQTNITGLTVNAATDANTLILTRTPGSISSATAVSFDLGNSGGSDGITNPSTTNVTFYARILTYPDDNDDGNGCDATDDSAVCYAPATPRLYTDAGGIALSTAAQIAITAKVQERLTFCIYAFTGGSCATPGSTAVALGDTNGVLDPAGPYVDVTQGWEIATNASGNAIVRVKGPTLTTGSFTIDPVTLGGGDDSAPGTEQFGMCTYATTGAGDITVDTDYDGDDGVNDCSDTTQTAGTGSTGGDGNSFFYFDPTVADTTYGDAMLTKVPGSTSIGRMAFLGNISNTTEAGIYTTTLTFIATGTY